MSQIDSKRLFGISVGDSYNLKADDDSSSGDRSCDGRCRRPRSSRSDQPAQASSPMNDVAVAVPVRTTRTKPVSIDVKSAGLIEPLRKGVAESTMLHEASEREARSPASSSGTGWSCSTPKFECKSPFTADASGVGRAVALAERIAKAEAFADSLPALTTLGSPARSTSSWSCPTTREQSCSRSHW